jgi:hypothetical protein
MRPHDGRIIFSRDVKFDESPVNRPQSIVIAVPPPSADIEIQPERESKGREGGKDEEGNKGKGRAEGGDRERERRTSAERDLDNRQHEDLLERLDALPQPKAAEPPQPEPASTRPASTRPRRQVKQPGEYWKLPPSTEPKPKSKWAHAVEYANFVALAPPSRPKIDTLGDAKKIPIPRTFNVRRRSADRLSRPNTYRPLPRMLEHSLDPQAPQADCSPSLSGPRLRRQPRRHRINQERHPLRADQAHRRRLQVRKRTLPGQDHLSHMVPDRRHDGRPPDQGSRLGEARAVQNRSGYRGEDLRLPRREGVLGIEYAKVAESTGRIWNPVEESGRRWKRWNSLHTTSISFYVTSP